MTIKATTLRALDCSDIILTGAGIRHYSNINFGTRYVESSTISSLLWKCHKKDEILIWKQFGRLTSKLSRSRGHGYSSLDVSVIDEYSGVDKIIAWLGNTVVDINICAYCKTELTRDKMSDCYSTHHIYRLHICHDCLEGMRVGDLKIRQIGITRRKLCHEL